MNFRVLVSYASSAADVPVTACSTSGVADLATAFPAADMLVMAWSTLGVANLPTAFPAADMLVMVYSTPGVADFPATFAAADMPVTAWSAPGVADFSTASLTSSPSTCPIQARVRGQHSMTRPAFALPDRFLHPLLHPHFRMKKKSQGPPLLPLTPEFRWDDPLHSRLQRRFQPVL